MHLRVEHLPCRIDRDVVVPSFLGDVDHPWLQRLIERADAAEGIRAADIEDHLTAPLSMSAPLAKQRLAAFMLAKLIKTRTDALITPRDARDRLFAAAAASDEPRARVLERVADAAGITPAQLVMALFADLPGEKIVVGVRPPTSPVALAAKANLWLAQAYVSRAVRVRLDVKGASRPLVLGAKTKGLLCTITGSADGAAAVLDLSGPLSLFKRTRLYGRSLASLLPTLAWCDRWIVDAECVVGGRKLTFRVSTGAPILPAEAPQRFDSKLEKRFAKEFEQKAPPYRLVREPRPVAYDEGLLFPDFAIEPLPGQGGPTFLVELVGFWTPAYVEDKLARYRRARVEHLVLCVDEELACADDALPKNARLVRFRKRVDVDAVLRAISGPP